MMTIENILRKAETKCLSESIRFKIFTSSIIKKLSEDEENIIYNILIKISSSSFDANQTSFWRSKRYDFGYLKNISTFILIQDIDSNAIIGWTGIRVFNEPKYSMCYLDSSGVIPKFFGTGLVAKANAYMIRKVFIRSFFKTLLLLCRTESPIIYRLLVKNLGFENVYPKITGETFNKKYKSGVKKIVGYLKQGHMIDYDSLIIKNAYGNLDELYGDLPVCSDQNINNFFQSKLGVNDAFLIIGIFKLYNLFRLGK